MGKRPEACRGLYNRELAATVFQRFPFVIGRICRADLTGRPGAEEANAHAIFRSNDD
jgi:hypothetical protein